MTPINLQPVFASQGQGYQIGIPNVEFSVTNFTNKNTGGAYSAEISASGSIEAVAALSDLLMCGVDVLNDRNDGVWWGFVREVVISIGNVEIGFSIDGMYNKVQVAYTEALTGTGVYGARKTTSWVTDTDSISRYGTRAIQLSGGNYTDAQAASVAAEYLALHKLPQITRRFSQSAPSVQGKATARIMCSGWYETLSWLYYSNAAGSVAYLDIGSYQQAVGKDGNTQIVRESIVPAVSWAASAYRIRVRKVGSPTANLKIELANGAGGLADVQLSATIAPANVSATMDWLSGTWATTFALTAAATYYLLVRTDAALDAVNYYEVEVNTALGYSGGVFSLWNGTSWLTRAPDADMIFEVSGVLETTQQLLNIIAQSGQFITGTDILSASGVYSGQYRDGDSTALSCIEELLKHQTAGGLRIYPRVTRARRMVFDVELASTAVSRYYIQADGELWSSADVKMSAELSPYGVWAVITGVLPDTVALGYFTDPRVVFVDSVTCNCESGRAEVFERGAPDPLNLEHFRL